MVAKVGKGGERKGKKKEAKWSVKTNKTKYKKYTDEYGRSRPDIKTMAGYEFQAKTICQWIVTMSKVTLSRMAKVTLTGTLISGEDAFARGDDGIGGVAEFLLHIDGQILELGHGL